MKSEDKIREELLLIIETITQMTSIRLKMIQTTMNPKDQNEHAFLLDCRRDLVKHKFDLDNAEERKQLNQEAQAVIDILERLIKKYPKVLDYRELKKQVEVIKLTSDATISPSAENRGMIKR